MARCPKCGVETTGRFCVQCGAQVSDNTSDSFTKGFTVPPPEAAARITSPQPIPQVVPPMPPTPGPPPPQAWPFTPGPQAPVGYGPTAAGSPFFPPFPAAPQPSTWQGVVALTLTFVVCGLDWIAVGAAKPPDDVDSIRLGAAAILIMASLFVLPLAIWAVMKNGKAGRIMGGISLFLVAFTLLFIFTR